MFWKFDLHTTSHIDQLLDREDVTLRELMEEDDVLQECKAQNRRLLLFLSQEHCMQELVITFLKKKEGFIGLVLKHIDASAMMDLLLRLISCVEPAPLRQEVLHRQSNASQTLCDIIRLSRDQANQMQENMEADPLLAVLESQESVAGLLKNMFDGERSEASIVNGTQVLLTLLETRRSGLEGLMDLYSQGYERSYTVSSSILNAIEPHIKDFQQLLLDPPKKSAILTTVGVLEQPLGNARLHVARLVAALLQTSALKDLFFKYSWNNFLHFQVELCVAAILNHPSEERPNPGLQNHDGNPAASDPEPQGEEAAETGGTSDPQTSVHNALVAHLFQKCQLVQRILDAWEENDKIQIANMVVQNLEKGPVQSQITDLIKELPEDCRGRWESFVDETLRETNRRNTVELVSTHNMHSSSEDDDMESPFPNDLSLQQAFSDYQIQQMTANFVDQFGFNDEEEFSEHDEN
ncbi:hypothetical protein FQN60_006020, partial [Etheostoma spectabile]